MLTKFLAKLIGLGIVLTVLSLVVNRQAAIATMVALFADPALIFMTGVFTLLLGLALVLGHNRWFGGALAVLVTLYG